jgi:hypothetical protein
MSSGATSSAGRAKKDWGRAEKGLVAMGVAWEIGVAPDGFKEHILIAKRTN